ncbi:MAG: dTMP kinase [Anaerolinea sp.]|nr:dTMP kinase [Anaerolinea sp.]
MSGFFITFEGPDGCGKTSQIPALAEFLRARGVNVLTTREPGGTEIGDQVRRVIMDLRNKGMDARTEILLFQASRVQIVEQVIRPALHAGRVVICDRYADSTLAYQGYGHQTDMTFLRQLLHFATGGLQPDLTLLLDVDVEEGLRRRQKGGGEWNRLDDYEVEFHHRVRAGYHQLVAEEPDRWVMVDAMQSREAIQLELREIILKRLSLD